MFVALEGGEGVGKTTQMEILKEFLPELFPHREFVFTREPGGTELAELIRSVILSLEAQAADGKTMFGLFAAARFDLMRRVIQPALKAGKVVITDRFVGSSFAYQVVAQENPISLGFFDEYLNELDVFPDYTFVLDMPVERSQERVMKRAGDLLTHFDTRSVNFHAGLRDGYHIFMERYGARNVHLIDASLLPDEIHSLILGVLAPVLSADPVPSA